MNSANFLLRFARKRWLQVLAGCLVVYAALGFLVLPAVIKAQVPKRLGPLVHRPVELARVRANPFALSLTLDGFQIRDKDGSPLVGWRRFHVGLSWQTLFRFSPVFRVIRLEGFHAHVALDKKGDPTFADLLTPAPAPAAPAKPAGNPPDLRIQHLEVVDARVEFLDQATSQPFATVLGPLNLGLENFRLSRDSRNPYAFDGRTERGETFGWNGHFLLEPLRSQGSFYVGKLYLPKYAPFYRDDVAFAIPAGTLDLKATYEFEWAEGSHVFRLHQGEVGLDSLAVAEAGRPGAAVELPSLRVHGIEADLMESWAKVAAIELRDGKLVVRRDKDGSLNLQRMAASRKPPEKPKDKPFKFDLAQLRIVNQTIAIQDLVPKKPVDLTVDQLGLTVDHFSLDKDASCDLELGLRWNGSGQLHAKGQAAPMKSSGALDFQIAGVDLAPFNGYLDPALEAVIAAGRLGISGHADFDAPAGRYAFKGQAQVDGFQASQGPARNATVGWKALKLAGIQSTSKPMALAMASIDWEGPTARFLQQPAAPVATAPPPAVPPPTAAPAPAGPAMKAEIGVFRMKGGAFTFVDRSIQPEAAMSLEAIEAQVGKLSTDPASRAQLELHAKVNGTAPFLAKGTVNLLSQAAYTDLLLTLGGMDLSPLTPYAGHFLGYPIEKGKLELDLRYLVQDRRLQAENRIRMDQLTLGEATNSPEAIHVPVKLGLALLRDRNGLIDLDVPVGGDLNQPDFKLSHVIWHAVLNVFAKIATSPFSLIGKAFGGGDADLSLVPFPPGSVAIEGSGLKVLATLAKGLYERPGLRLEMEGSVDEAQDGPALKRAELDQALARLKGAPVEAGERPRWVRAAYLQAFPPPAKDPKAPKDAVPPPEPAPAEMEARLLDRVQLDPAALKLLARKRVQAAQERLLEGGKVEPERLFMVEGSDRAKKEPGSRVLFNLK